MGAAKAIFLKNLDSPLTKQDVRAHTGWSGDTAADVQFRLELHGSIQPTTTRRAIGSGVLKDYNAYVVVK